MLQPLICLRGQPPRHARTKSPAHRRLFLEPLEDRLLLSLWIAAENLAYFGNLNQHSLDYLYPKFGTGSDNMACGPAAATNSLVYLQNAYPSLYGRSLIAAAGRSMQGAASYTLYDDWIYTAGGVLATSPYMNTTKLNGTYDNDFITGLYDYSKTAAPGKLTYSAQDSWAPDSWGTYSKPPSWVSAVTPTWNYLYSSLRNSADVLTLLSYVNSGGHYVSIEGMIWNDATDSGTMTFLDPWVGKSTTTAIRLSSGRLYTDYGGSDGSWISVIDVLTPVQVRAVPFPVYAAAAGRSTIAMLWNPSGGASNYCLDYENPAVTPAGNAANSGLLSANPSALDYPALCYGAVTQPSSQSGPLDADAFLAAFPAAQSQDQPTQSLLSDDSSQAVTPQGTGSGAHRASRTTAAFDGSRPPLGSSPAPHARDQHAQLQHDRAAAAAPTRTRPQHRDDPGAAFPTTTAGRNSLPLVSADPSVGGRPALNDQVLLHWQTSTHGLFAWSAPSAGASLSATSPQRAAALPVAGAASPPAHVPAGNHAVQGTVAVASH